MSAGRAPSPMTATIGMANELISEPSQETLSPAQTFRKSLFLQTLPLSAFAASSFAV
jgi:hypothetical protein